jgi:hypothetical protein
MKHNLSSARSVRALALLAIGSALTLTVIRSGTAQESKANSSFQPLQTSINAVMVDLVDHAAHNIWDASYAEVLNGRDWQEVEQHAIQLVASGTLMSLGGTGPQDRGWVASPVWQEWSRKLIDSGLSAQAAVKATDQKALETAGDVLVQTCIGCHQAFKPDLPTEGILHIPHYDE